MEGDEQDLSVDAAQDADTFWNSYDTEDVERPQDETDASSREYHRDDTGRFAEKPKDESVAEETPSEEEAPAVPPEPVPHDAPAEGSDPAPVVEAPPQEPETEPEPFVVAYNDHQFHIPGSKVTADGAFIPKEQFGTLHKFIGAGLKLESIRHEVRAAQAAAKEELADARAEKEAVQKTIDEMFEIAAEPDDQKFAERALLLMLDLRQNLPLLKDRRELAREKRDLARQRHAMQPDPETEREQVLGSLRNTIDGHIAHLRKHPTFKDLRDKDWETIATKAKADPARYGYRVKEPMTAEEQAAGCKPGEWVFNARLFDGEVSDRAALVREFTETAHAAAATARDNATKLAREAAPPPPPAPAARPGSTAGKKTGTPEFATRDEWLDYMNG